jgi:hypothetical protein
MTQPVGEFSLDLERLNDPVGLAFQMNGQAYRAIGMRRAHNGDLAISWRSRCATAGDNVLSQAVSL